MKVKLTPADLKTVTEIADQRYDYRVRRGLVSRGHEQEKRDNLIGAAGEFVVARLLGTDVYDDWLTNRAFWGTTIVPGDVGLAVQVKAMGNRHHNMLIPNDKSNRSHTEHAFVLVLVELLPDVDVLGWIHGHEAMTPANWCDHLARPAWKVSPDDLEDFATLPPEYVR